ncbi:AraC family transcriptional regulator [Pseudomonas sp. KCJK8993]|uniref:AraC family transcriptional regulator n=1 Tax=Pseudomonas sp. KCJK8993 TaxID=3344565 RepID=UPI003906C473
MFTPLVRAVALHGFHAFAKRQGLNSAEMLRRASLPLDCLQKPEALLPYRRFCRLLELCAAQSGNALFGLQLGLYQGVDVFGDLFYLIRNSKTLGDALTELQASYSLYFNDAVIELDIEGERAILSYRLKELNTPGLQQVEESACGVGVQLMRTLAGSHWQAKAIRFRHAPLLDESSYLQALGQQPRFNEPSTALEFDSSDLALALGAKNEALHGLIAKHINKVERLSEEELSSYIQQLLRYLLPCGRATTEKISNCLAIHPRTLQHWLEHKVTSFQRLLDETRQELAGQYLLDSSISMAQMSGLLGYSTPSGFNRAFNRWFGVTPSQWQKQQGVKRQPRLLRNAPFRV